MVTAGEARKLTAAVGWMSLGFGIFDILMANRLASKVGMERDTPFRLAGAREVATGVAAIAFPQLKLPITARLAGDTADLATLGALAVRRENPRRLGAWLGVGIVAAVTALDILTWNAQIAARQR